MANNPPVDSIAGPDAPDRQIRSVSFCSGWPLDSSRTGLVLIPRHPRAIPSLPRKRALQRTERPSRINKACLFRTAKRTPVHPEPHRRHSRTAVIPAPPSFPHRRHSRTAVIPAPPSFPHRRHSRTAVIPAPPSSQRTRGSRINKARHSRDTIVDGTNQKSTGATPTVPSYCVSTLATTHPNLFGSRYES